MSIATVVIHVGQSHRFPLQSSAGTGYLWMLDRLPAGARVEGIEDSSAAGPGADTTRTFTIFGGHVGTGLLSFVLRRPWAPVSDAERREYHVIVDQGGGPIPLYAATMQQAVASGDLAHMQAVAAQAEAHVGQTPEIQSALAALKAEIARHGGHPIAHPLYAVPIRHCIARGDLAEMTRLAAEAAASGDKSPEVAAALADLQAEIAKRGGHPVPQPLYGVPIRRCIAGGNLAEMKQLAAAAAASGDKSPEVVSALADLQAAIAKAGG